MNYQLTKNDIAYQLIHFRPEGTAIPDNWYKHIKKKNGKTYYHALIILADIVRWYTPVTNEIDRDTGESKPPRKKYGADILQIGYKHFENRYGLTEDQIRRALRYLESSGFIKWEMRVIELKENKKINAPYVRLFPQRVIEISDPLHEEGVVGKIPPGWWEKSHHKY